MLRLLNILAVLALVGSAVYAYTIKYQTSYRAEQIAKTKIEIKAEQDAIAVLRADWAYMTRPERLQPLADRYLPDLGPLKVTQLVSPQALPQKTRGDSIGAKLSEIGLSAPATPPAAPGAPTTTPKSEPAKAKSATPKATAARAPNAGPTASSQEPKKP
jgi:hypothetical protein